MNPFKTTVNKFYGAAVEVGAKELIQPYCWMILTDRAPELCPEFNTPSDRSVTVFRTRPDSKSLTGRVELFSKGEFLGTIRITCFGEHGQETEGQQKLRILDQFEEVRKNKQLFKIWGVQLPGEVNNEVLQNVGVNATPILFFASLGEKIGSVTRTGTFDWEGNVPLPVPKELEEGEVLSLPLVPMHPALAVRVGGAYNTNKSGAIRTGLDRDQIKRAFGSFGF
jgi:hypothetical protein